MKQDITNKQDIILLIDAFYEQVKTDAVIGYFFTEVNWEAHLPRMYDFWENVVFHTGDYDGNPMIRHQKLHQKSPMRTEHFEHWLILFCQTVDGLFEGAQAEVIKQRAESITTIMQHKILG